MCVYMVLISKIPPFAVPPCTNYCLCLDFRSSPYQTSVLETSCGWSTWSSRASKLIVYGNKCRLLKKKKKRWWTKYKHTQKPRDSQSWHQQAEEKIEHCFLKTSSQGQHRINSCKVNGVEWIRCQCTYQEGRKALGNRLKRLGNLASKKCQGMFNSLGIWTQFCRIKYAEHGE